jgi:glycyl-tRNA synthetase beta subunit
MLTIESNPDDKRVLAYRSVISSEPLKDKFQDILEDSLEDLIDIFPRNMRWNKLNWFSFPRPIRWILVLHGSECIPFEPHGYGSI